MTWLLTSFDKLAAPVTLLNDASTVAALFSAKTTVLSPPRAVKSAKWHLWAPLGEASSCWLVDAGFSSESRLHSLSYTDLSWPTFEEVVFH